MHKHDFTNYSKFYEVGNLKKKLHKVFPRCTNIISQIILSFTKYYNLKIKLHKYNKPVLTHISNIKENTKF